METIRPSLQTDFDIVSRNERSLNENIQQLRVQTSNRPKKTLSLERLQRANTFSRSCGHVQGLLLRLRMAACHSRLARDAIARLHAHSGEARAREVYEEAVGVCTHSVELWALYAAHAVQHFETPEKVRGLFERAVALVGGDYLAAPLWDRYIACAAATADRNSADHARAGALYVRVLQLPLKALSSYWAKFQQWAATRSCSELLDEAAEAELRVPAELLPRWEAAFAEVRAKARAAGGAVRGSSTRYSSSEPSAPIETKVMPSAALGTGGGCRRRTTGPTCSA